MRSKNLFYYYYLLLHYRLSWAVKFAKYRCFNFTATATQPANSANLFINPFNQSANVYPVYVFCILFNQSDKVFTCSINLISQSANVSFNSPSNNLVILFFISLFYHSANLVINPFNKSASFYYARTVNACDRTNRTIFCKRHLNKYKTNNESWDLQRIIDTKRQDFYQRPWRSH